MKEKVTISNDLENLPHFFNIPRASKLWPRFINLAWIVLGFFFFDQLTKLFANKWLLESLGFSSVFWTNFKTGTILFLVGFFLFSWAIIIPFLFHRAKKKEMATPVNFALIFGLICGYFLCFYYHDMLKWIYGSPFNKIDPIFSNDFSFYAFTVPALWIIWWTLLLASICLLLTSLYRAYTKSNFTSRRDIATVIGQLSIPPTLIATGSISVIVSAGFILSKYDILNKDNTDSAIFNGAQYIDYVGFFTTVTAYYVSALITLAIGAVIIVNFYKFHKATKTDVKRPKLLRFIFTLTLLLMFDFAFKGIVSLRDLIFVQPNEPVIQLTNIERHIEYTLYGYGLDKVEAVPFVPNGQNDPLPNVDKLVNHPVVKNAPLWPGYVSYLERLLDPQHSKRIFQTNGDTMIYGPTLEAFHQQQKLRTYYDFINVDTVRYQFEDGPKLLVSGVREVPLLEPVPWLAWWGQRFVLFTHGSGLVMASSTDKTVHGDPLYFSSGIPTTSSYQNLRTDNPKIYYGEGSTTMAYSNIEKMKEFDYPTDEGRSIMVLPDEVKSGVYLDSVWKRVVFGWLSGQFFEIVFSDLISKKTRVHYFRTPIERIESLSPFLYFDTNPYAVVGEGGIHWIVNALTTTDKLPYSKYHWLGDKSDQRTRFTRDLKRTNYVRDAIKATIDAYTGQVKLYTMNNGPIVRTWANVYPGLFTSKNHMPKYVKEHLQYPIQLFHIQFDDVYIYYHMRDPMTFFNMEDMWDDGDEVRGPILDQGKAITFSIEPYRWIAATDGNPLPKTESKTQFAMSMMFTPQSALNLRAIPVVYQDGDSYGRLISLQIPKGHYFLGPEQADSSIDQEPKISEQISWWNRRGTDVIRGHTTALIIENELIYVEPIFIRSQQNPVTQLKKVIVVFRGEVYMADTLEEALTKSISNLKQNKKRKLSHLKRRKGDNV